VQANGTLGSGGVTFVGSGGELKLDPVTAPTAVISGFGAYDKIDVHLTYSAGATASASAPGEVTISSGNNTYSLNIAGASSTDNYEVVSAPNGFSTLEEEPAGPSASVAVARMSFIKPAASAAKVTDSRAALVHSPDVLHAETLKAATISADTTGIKPDLKTPDGLLAHVALLGDTKNALLAVVERAGGKWA
jgi:hypothetical protein